MGRPASRRACPRVEIRKPAESGAAGGLVGPRVGAAGWRRVKVHLWSGWWRVAVGCLVFRRSCPRTLNVGEAVGRRCLLLRVAGWMLLDFSISSPRVGGPSLKSQMYDKYSTIEPLRHRYRFRMKLSSHTFCPRF